MVPPIINKLVLLCFHATVQPEAEASGVQLSNGMPRQTAPLPSSPPPQLNISTLDQVDQGGEFSFFVSKITHQYILSTFNCMNSCQNAHA